MFSGKKTYIAAAVAVVSAIGAYLSGDTSLIDALQLGFTAVIGAFVRHGVAKA